MDDTPRTDATEPPSRSQRRRDALATLALAERLVAMQPAQLNQLELPEGLHEEIARVRTITARGARKRELAYLAKLMRRQDDDALAPARAALGEDRRAQQRDAAAFKRAEALRDRLLEGDHAALTALIDDHPGIDRQRLNALIRQARTERERDKSPRAARELFRLLRDLPPA